MKVAVFGSAGMAGHIISHYLKDKTHGVATIARSGAHFNCDIENIQKVAATLQHFGDYDYIVNCVGLLVKDSINRPDRAAIINAWFPHYLEQWSKDKKARIIHLSTDCVFSGSSGYYKEGDTHTETNAYGKSKSYGEINNSKDITFRTSIIGPELKENGTGLLHWVTNNRSSTLDGYVDAWWNGVTTLQLAKCIWQWMQDPTVTGVYHLVNNSVNTNKYELLKTICSVYGLDKTVTKTTGPKVVNKILVDTRLEVDWSIPDYLTQLTELRDYRVTKN